MTKDGFKQDDLARAGRERVHKRQASHANNFQPKPKHSGNKRCEQNPDSQSKQASFDPTQIVALCNTSKAKRDDLASEASRNQNCRSNMTSPTNEEEDEEHQLIHY